jgi:hypothetical protein
LSTAAAVNVLVALAMSKRVLVVKLTSPSGPVRALPALPDSAY